MKIKELWEQTADFLALPSKKRNLIWNEVKKHYSQAGRYYHTLSHLDHMSSQIKLNSKMNVETVFAILYHDLIQPWETHEISNYDAEQESSLRAQKRLRELGLPWGTQGMVHAMIFATKSHKPPADGITDRFRNDIEYFLDLDLSILGSEPSTYEVYRKNVRKEYGWVTIDKYNEGRVTILNSFLDRSYIYHTEEMRSSLETQARINISNEIRELIL